MNKPVTASAIRPTKSPLATKFIVVLRVLLGAMSMAGLLGWAYLTLFALAWGGGAILVHPVVFFLLFGYVYLLLSPYLCFKNPPINTLTIIGGLLNLPPIVYFIYLVSHIEDKLQLAAFVPVAFVLVWFLLWLLRWFVARNVSTSKQILAIVIVLVGVIAGAAALKPLTTDPDSEARRLSAAGAQARNPDEAKRLFAKARDQANRIKNPYIREQPLSVIAYNQAKAGLIYDAEANANECESDGARKIAFNSIVRGQLESGDWRGAVMTAKSHEAGGVLFMALKENSVAKAQTGQIESAKEIMRFAEQTADDPAFESLRRWSFSAVAVAQAQLGLHDEALSSARKTGAEYAPEQLAFIAMTEKQAGYLEQSRASVQEAIRGVVALRKDTVSRDNTLYELAAHLSDGGLFDEARLVANSIQSISTKEILFRSMEYARARRPR